MRQNEIQRFAYRAMLTISVLALVFAAPRAFGVHMVMKTESFDSDPGWEGHNNRVALQHPPITITNNFGFKNSVNAGGPAGEIGGSITPAGEPAYYAKILGTPLTLNDSFNASGTLKVSGQGHTLLGFFNSDTINEWRTANTLALRLYGRNSFFYGYSEYGTSKWRAGGNTWTQGGSEFQFNSSAVHNWSLSYNPAGNGGGGTMTAVMDGMTIVQNLGAGHKSDGATFDRFGLLNIVKSYDTPGLIYVDNLNVNGATHNFDTNPGAEFEGLRNNAAYPSSNVRPWFNFGHSASSNSAGGTAAGELGGETFRGDSRLQFNGTRMAYYGDPLAETLTFNHRLHAEGKIALHRGVSDSTTLIGFFHSADSMRNSDSQSSATPENFVGAVIEGPSAEGFYFYPTYGVDQEGVRPSGNRGIPTPPFIYPNGDSRDWTLDYDPAANNGRGRVTVTLDGQAVNLNLDAGHKQIGGRFNRFGIVTTHIDGNGQTVYFDDLIYTIGTLAGDFNDDGKVDAADYVAWRNGLGTTYTEGDYAVWRANFGQTASSAGAAGSISSDSAVVPEPACAALLLAGLLVVLAPHRGSMRDSLRGNFLEIAG